MNNLIIYSLEVALGLALFYSVYYVFLKNETFFKTNRFYLLFSVLLCLCLPMFNISIGGELFLSKHLISPIEQYEQQLMGNIIAEHNVAIDPDHESKKNSVRAIDQENESTSDLSQLSSPNLQEGTRSNKPINWLGIGLIIYFIGAAMLFIRFAFNFIRIISYVLKHKGENVNGVRVIRYDKTTSPFSFLNFIFLEHKEYPVEELTKIISHEKVHIRQKHSIDLILLELVLIFQWFNPFVWFYKRSIKMTHEYLADLGTLNSGVDLPGYQYSLLNQVLAANDFEIASSYNFSVKKRIAMMLRKRSSKLATLKVIVALPVLFFLFSAFAFDPAQAVSEQVSKVNVDVAIGSDTTIKEVGVPLEYLKLLEGEYVSTNEPKRERHIVFTELLGYLYGLDNGYTYRIIPLGGESFINPDDKASLVFDSKDKQAISLLLFGRINLKKMLYAKGDAKVQNRSLAFTMANVMLKKGIPAGLSYYKAAKDSSHCYLSEDQLNYAGYVLLQSKKLKEAAAIFKLNTELFPQGYNAYDSYAESLLELGDKNGAIENYKKSLLLNPGSKSALSHLEQLGVKTEGLVQKANVSADYLKLLAGDYLSTNEGNWVRWIRFTEENGLLYGGDNGYRYQLIPMGDGKFINPDDGASGVFDTKNKDAITLTLFGRVNLKKVPTLNESDVDLKKYTGHFAPQADDVTQKPAEIYVSNNKIFRKIESEPEGPNRIIELQAVAEHIFFYKDNSGRSLEFLVNEKNEVTAFVLRRGDGRYKLIKQK